MIDTIILKIPYGSYMITDHNKFSPSTEALFKENRGSLGARGFVKYTQNPTPNDYKVGNYGPRLTVTRRYTPLQETPLKIEFSAPKLLYGNNVDEVSEEDFPKVLDLLSKKLTEMGVNVLPSILEGAVVSVVHFSKNIALTDYYTASLVIKELGKLDVSKKLDLNNRHFQNDGHALYFYAKSYSLVFYDKLKDIKMPKGRAVESEKLPGQLGLLGDIRKPLEILRFEARLTNKQKLNSVLKNLGFNKNPTFKEIFQLDLARKVLLDFWNLVYTPRTMFVLGSNDKPESLFKIILTNSRNLGKKPSAESVLALVGASLFAKEHGIRALRNTVSSSFSDRTWYRLSKRLEGLSHADISPNRLGFVNEIEGSLRGFKTLKTADLGVLE